MTEQTRSQKETMAKKYDVLKGLSLKVNITRKQKVPNSKANTQFCSEKGLKNSVKEQILIVWSLFRRQMES